MENKKIYIKTFLVILLCYAGLHFLTTTFGNEIKAIFYNAFIFSYSNGTTNINWHRLEDIFTIFVLVIIPLIYFILQMYTKAKIKKEKQAMTQEILSIFDEEHIVIDKKDTYAEIKTMILKLRMEKENQKELFEKEQNRKNDLITYLAHDLKTPLASVIGYISFLDETNELPVKQRKKYTKIALEKAYRLEDLIEQFFEITRFNLQNIIINKEKIDIHLMLEQLVDAFYPIVQKQKKEINLEVKDATFIYADSDKLGRVLNNILKNALAYSYEKTTIQIKEYTKNDILYIKIINQGDPIPPYKLERIFEKFYRLDSARNTKNGGAGLGLAIAKEIMEAHGGQIGVCSDEKETSFILELPLNAKEPYHS